MSATTTPQLKEGHYNVEQEFTSGKDYSIFQAYDTGSEEPVTIAEVPVRLPKVATIAQRDAVAAAFKEQAQALTLFKHKSALAIRDHFVEAGRHYVVTDPLDGVDLASVLADKVKPFGSSEITSWSDTLLDVLNSLHVSRPPFVYKHLRPDCVILRADGSVALALWGMLDLNSRITGTAEALDGEQSSIVYSPLEQIWSGLDAASQKVIVSKYDEASERTLKQPLDARSDIYSLGAVLYQLITGRVPVDALERSIEMIEGGPDPLKAPNKMNPSVPTEISDVIMKAMDIRREYRFDSAAIMRQVMRTAVVRVKEREEEERLEEEEALAKLRSAQAALLSSQTAQKPAAEAASSSGVKPVDQTIPANDTSHEARLAQSARATEAFKLEDLDDDLLGLLSDTSTPPNPIHVSSSAEAEKADVTASGTRAENGVEPESHMGLSNSPWEEVAAHSDDENELSDDAFEARRSGGEEDKDEAVDAPNLRAAEFESVPEVATVDTANELELFHEEKSSSRGVMVAAAGVIVACLAAVGGWFLLGSGTAASKPNTAAPPPAVITQAQQDVPVQTEPQPSQSPELITIAVPSPEAETPIEGEPMTDQPQKIAASSTQRPRKQTPAAPRTTAPKKPVTVDDLINDN